MGSTDLRPATRHLLPLDGPKANDNVTRTGPNFRVTPGDIGCDDLILLNDTTGTCDQ